MAFAPRPRLPPAALLAGLLLANLWVYVQGMHGPYVADDFPNLASNHALLIEDWSWEGVRAAALSSPASPFGRPLAMLSFALSYSAAGNLDPYSAKLVNVVLHLLCGAGVYLLSAALLARLHLPGKESWSPAERRTLATVIAAAWMFHPLFVSTVLYAVQRMSLLSALFMFWGAYLYLRLRERLARRNRDYYVLALAVSLFTGAAFLCKENGALLPGLLALVDWFCFGLRAPPGAPRAGRWLWLGMLLAPTAFVVLYLARYGALHWNDTAPTYFFSVRERFLTQFRALTDYAGWLMFVNPEPYALYHDDIPVSSSLLSPATTLACAAFWSLAVALALWLARTRHVFAFGLLWFLWGHALESSVLPLAPVFEHRNYLPGFGIVLGCAVAAALASARLAARPAIRWGLLLLPFVALPFGLLVERVRVWGDERALVAQSLEDQPDSALTLLMGAYFLDSRGDYAGSLTALRAAQDLDPRDAAFVLAEAALRCENRPGERYDAELIRALDVVDAFRVRTTTALGQFVEMAKVCSGSPTNDAALFPLYRRLRGHRHYAVAMYALYGMGAVRLHRGDAAGALAYWDEAVAKYPQAAGLKPDLDKLRRRFGNPAPRGAARG